MTRRSAPPVRARAKTVAVLPFGKTANRSDLDFLSTALPDEIARVLGYARSLSVRPFDSSRRYEPQTDPRLASRELHAGTIVTGEFTERVNQIEVLMRAIDAASNRYFWREVVATPAGNTIALRALVAAKAREGLGPLLGVTEFTEEGRKTRKRTIFMSGRTVLSPSTSGARARAEIHRARPEESGGPGE